MDKTVKVEKLVQVFMSVKQLGIIRMMISRETITMRDNLHEALSTYIDDDGAKAMQQNLNKMEMLLSALTIQYGKLSQE